MIVLFLSLSVSQCSSAQRLEPIAPLDFGEVYYQKRVQAVKDLESMFTIFIPVMERTRTILNWIQFILKEGLLK